MTGSMRRVHCSMRESPSAPSRTTPDCATRAVGTAPPELFGRLVLADGSSRRATWRRRDAPVARSACCCNRDSASLAQRGGGEWPRPGRHDRLLSTRKRRSTIPVAAVRFGSGSATQNLISRTHGMAPWKEGAAARAMTALAGPEVSVLPHFLL